jgi:hypothetical protein
MSSHGHGVADRPVGFGRFAPHAVFGFGRAFEHAESVVIEFLAGLGHGDPARRARQKRQAKLEFELLNTVADG